AEGFLRTLRSARCGDAADPREYQYDQEGSLHERPIRHTVEYALCVHVRPRSCDDPMKPFLLPSRNSQYHDASFNTHHSTLLCSAPPTFWRSPPKPPFDISRITSSGCASASRVSRIVSMSAIARARLPRSPRSAASWSGENTSLGAT